MNFSEVVLRRRSIRRYSDFKVPDQIIETAIDCALLAPNSSNLQPWEFYWVQSPDKKSKLIEACLSQGAARTASHLVVAVARLDTWKRNRDLLVQNADISADHRKMVESYYLKLIPLIYTHDPLGLFGLLKWTLFRIVSLFRPMTIRPATRRDLWEVAIKTTALACENFMLSITDQGFASCPMEGFDERRVKKILNLGCSSRIVMVISVGEGNDRGLFGKQYRIPKSLSFFKV